MLVYGTMITKQKDMSYLSTNDDAFVQMGREAYKAYVNAREDKTHPVGGEVRENLQNLTSISLVKGKDGNFYMQAEFKQKNGEPNYFYSKIEPDGRLDWTKSPVKGHINGTTIGKLVVKSTNLYGQNGEESNNWEEKISKDDLAALMNNHIKEMKNAGKQDTKFVIFPVMDFIDDFGGLTDAKVKIAVEKNPSAFFSYEAPPENAIGKKKNKN